MALQSRRKLALAGALLGASMLPLSLETHWQGPRLAEPEVLIITLVTMGLGLWGAFGGRVAYVLMLLRAGLQLFGTLLMLTHDIFLSLRCCVPADPGRGEPGTDRGDDVAPSVARGSRPGVA